MNAARKKFAPGSSGILFFQTCYLFLLFILPVTANAVSLNDYSILAGTNVTIGGGSQVNGGRIGAGGNVVFAGNTFFDGDVDGLANVQLNNGADVLGTITNPGNFSASVTATYGGHVTGTPVLPALPAATAFSSGGTDYTLGNGASLALAPGSYGDVHLGGSATLKLSSGDYFFDEIVAGNGLDLLLDLTSGSGHINIYVTQQVNFGNVDTLFVGGVGSAFDVYLEAQRHSSPGNQFAFASGGGTDWVGLIYTPFAGIHLGGGSCCSSFNGALWAAGAVDIEHGVTGSSHMPEPGTVLLLGSGLALAARRRKMA